MTVGLDRILLLASFPLSLLISAFPILLALNPLTHRHEQTSYQNWPLAFLLKVLNQLMSRQSKYLSVRLDKDFWQTNRKQETNDS